MKNLKCTSCGANISIDDESKEFATCPYCHAKYQLNERKNIYINLDDNTKELLESGMKQTGKMSKMFLIPVIAFVLIFAIIFISIITSFHSHKDSINNNIINNNSTEKQIEDTFNKVQKTINKSSFNSRFESYSGTKSKFLLESLLDNTVTNNKTNKDMLVTVIYNDNKTTDPDAIVDLKHSLKDNKKYEVKLDYDDDGYVNTITIEDIK